MVRLVKKTSTTSGLPQMTIVTTEDVQVSLQPDLTAELGDQVDLDTGQPTTTIAIT